MSERKSAAIFAGSILSASLIAAALTAILLTNYCGRIHMQVLENVCQEILQMQPETAPAVRAALKHTLDQKDIPQAGVLLPSYGYRASDFFRPVRTHIFLFSLAGLGASAALFGITWGFRRQRDAARIRDLTDYLEKINTGGGGVLLPAGEDDFSRLQDEICKTVTELRQTRSAALDAKNHFAENLYNIAHQIKTPITAISLAVQTLQETAAEESGAYPAPSSKQSSPRPAIHPDCRPVCGRLTQIRRQLSRLSHLEEALLLLSRIDAGTLPLEPQDTDVFTLLMLAADNLQELSARAAVSIDVPESDAVPVRADPDWTMEAFMNLFKNCLEHTPPGGTVRCDYERNPLYVQIRIRDTGAGFASEDLPHLFERFYRGKNASGGGIGIGLALSKAIIESQNGTVSAANLPDGGACFEVRFYA